MPKIRVLSGKEVIRIFESVGFTVAGQKGSHIKMKRIIDGNKQTLTIPNHAELDKGTTRAIYAQALQYVSEVELRSRFYAD